MSRETLIVVKCDLHQLRDEDVPGTQYDFAVRHEGEPFTFVTIDLCESCGKQVTELTAELVEAGRPFEGDAKAVTAAQHVNRKAAGRPLLSPVCPVCQTEFMNRPSMRQHCRSQHGMTVAQAEGRAEPLQACPDCGQEFEGRAALASHRRVHAHPTTDPDRTEPVE